MHKLQMFSLSKGSKGLFKYKDQFIGGLDVFCAQPWVTLAVAGFQEAIHVPICLFSLSDIT